MLFIKNFEFVIIFCVIDKLYLSIYVLFLICGFILVKDSRISKYKDIYCWNIVIYCELVIYSFIILSVGVNIEVFFWNFLNKIIIL